MSSTALRDVCAVPVTAACGPAAACPACSSPPDILSSLPPAGDCAERTEWAVAWLAANCHRLDVTVAEAAKAVRLSPRRLQSVFKRDCCMGPVRLLVDMRLRRVHLALTGHGPAPASIAEAAALAGFSRVTRFRAAYRRRYGRYPALPGAPPGGG